MIPNPVDPFAVIPEMPEALSGILQHTDARKDPVSERVKILLELPKSREFLAAAPSPRRRGPSKHMAKLSISMASHADYWMPAAAGMTVWNPCAQCPLDFFMRSTSVHRFTPHRAWDDIAGRRSNRVDSE